MVQTLLKALFKLVLRFLFKPALNLLPVHLARRFADFGLLLFSGPAETNNEKVGEKPFENTRFWIGGGGDPALRPAVLWAHGGGFVLGGTGTHNGLAGWIAQSIGGDVYLPSYRLAPEHSFPAATDDFFEAYRQVLARGHDPARIAIGGDSAGGCIAILTALAIREMDLPRPAALALISPVTDLAMTGASFSNKARRDPFLSSDWLRPSYAAWAGNTPLTDPKISPLYADLHGLPPTLIQVAEEEILLDDSLRFADRAWAAGAEVELQRFPGFWHDFQLQADLIDDSRRAIEDIGAFLGRRFTN